MVGGVFFVELGRGFFGTMGLIEEKKNNPHVKGL
jgi:hypothetical protein